MWAAKAISVAWICTSGSWNPVPLQDITVKPSGVTDQLVLGEPFPVKAAEVLPGVPALRGAELICVDGVHLR